MAAVIIMPRIGLKIRAIVIWKREIEMEARIGKRIPAQRTEWLFTEGGSEMELSLIHI